MFLIEVAQFYNAAKEEKHLHFTNVYYAFFFFWSGKLGAKLSAQRKPLAYILVITIFLPLASYPLPVLCSYNGALLFACSLLPRSGPGITDRNQAHLENCQVDKYSPNV